MPRGQVEKSKGPNNEPITLFAGKKQDPTFAIIGDTDLVMGLNLHGAVATGLVKEMLDIRSGQAKSNVLKGKMAADFQKVSDKAYALAVGVIPAEMKRDLGAPRGPFSALPSTIAFEAQRGTDAVELRFRGKLNTAAETKAFVEECLKLRGMGMDLLKRNADKSPFPVEPILKTMSSIKMEAKNDGVSAAMRVTDENISTMINALTRLTNDEKLK